MTNELKVIIKEHFRTFELKVIKGHFTYKALLMN